jgi:putative tricarboxylic transport membrane protein
MVEGNSDIDTIDEFVERARQDPPTVGGIGAAQVDFIVNTLLAREADYDFTYIPFNAQGALVTALLSGSVDAIVANPGEVIGLIESGDVKPLAYTGVSTPEALGDLPTLQEAGYDVAMSMPRGLVLPPDVSDEVLEYWIGVMEQVVETPEWQDYIANQMLTENVLYGDDFRQFIIDTRETFATILREEGVID